MSVLDFTLYPKGGAFMLCESLGEFDSNVPLKQETELASLSDDKVAPYIEKSIASCDYVQMVSRKLGEVWSSYVDPLMRYPLDDMTDEGIIKTTEMISSYATAIADDLQYVISKITAAHAITNSSRCESDFEYGGLKTLVGIYLKNKQNLIRDGYDKFAYNVRSHPFFGWNGYTLSRRLLGCRDILKKQLLTSDILDEFSNNDAEFSKYFSSITDMMTTCFSDYDRLLRQEEHSTYTRRLSEYVKYNMSSDPEIAQCGAKSSDRDTELMNTISHMLRKTKQHMYDIQSELMDAESLYKNSEYNKRFYHTISLIVNVFVISVIYCFSCAYNISASVDTHNNVNQYAEDLMKRYH